MHISLIGPIHLRCCVYRIVYLGPVNLRHRTELANLSHRSVDLVLLCIHELTHLGATDRYRSRDHGQHIDVPAEVCSGFRSESHFIRALLTIV